MKMIQVKSSNIHSFSFERGMTKGDGFNDEGVPTYGKGTLRIKFHGGKTFDYHGVSDDEVADFVQAQSMGKHFAKFIKTKHTGVEVKTQ